MSFHAKQQSQRQHHAQALPLSLKSHLFHGPASLLLSLGMDGAHGVSLPELPVMRLGWRRERGPSLAPGWGLRGQQILESGPPHLSFPLRLPV